MKKKEKRALLILIIVAVLIIGAIWFLTRGNNKEQTAGAGANKGEQQYVQVQQDGTKVNTSNKINENKEIEGFTIENVRFIERDGVTELRADVTNRTNEAKEGFLMDIVLYDKSGNEMGRIPGNVIETQAGETIEICAGITGIVENYISAYDFKMVKK